MQAWWARPAVDVLAELGTRGTGLTTEEAAARLVKAGPNRVDTARREPAWEEFVRQVKSPLVLMLVFAAVLSAATGAWADAAIVLAIVLASAGVGFYQEHRAGQAMEGLRSRLSLRTLVVRGGEREVPADELVPGDVVVLGAGTLIPADGILLEARDLHVNEAALTGETLPVEKSPGETPEATALSQRTNAVWMGTDVRNGSGLMVVTTTGKATLYGGIAGSLAAREVETDFERGLRHFGVLLTRIMGVLVVGVLVVTLIGGKPVVEGLMFAIALAVGLAPELLPAVLALNLSRGAKAMAERGVVVRRLPAIENFGAMDVLCTDKTGTLTAGTIQLGAALAPDGTPSPEVFRLAWRNARWHSGVANAMDTALLQAGEPPDEHAVRRDEVPYDFQRRRLSVVVDAQGLLLITKGAVESVLAVCSHIREGGAPVPLDAARRQQLHDRCDAWAADGQRVLGVASVVTTERPKWGVRDEAGLVFEGVLLFLDPPKPGAAEAVQALAALGVELKVITGDHPLVALHLVRALALPTPTILTGPELQSMSDEALGVRVRTTNVFAQVDPGQKERIVRLLRKSGHVVGYMGDGINDAPALRAADVGISVDDAVDVAREAADFVMLRPDLDVLRAAIVEGRRVFANTRKYILTTSSANLGNMVSMAVTAGFLPFLPLLATQVLLNNFLSDIPAFAIARDAVDPELVEKPERWDNAGIRRFMVVFGLVSAVFDLTTFAVMLYIFHAPAELFRTAWFVESLLTELVVALVVRTRRLAWRSRPGAGLWWSTVAVVVLALVLPYLPWVGAAFAFVPLPWPVLLAIVGITVAYAAAAEGTKAWFYRQGG